MAAKAPGRRPKYLLLLLGSLSAFGPLALDMFLAGLPALAQELRAGEATAQLAVSLCMVGLALGQLIAGPLSDRFGRRIPLLAGVLVFVVSAFGCALAPSIEVLLVLRLLTGLGGGAGVVVARAMIRDLYQGEAALRAFSLVTVVSGVAPVIAPLLGSGLLLITDWRGVFAVLGLIGLGQLAAALMLGETLAPEQRRASGLGGTLRTMGGLLGDRSFIFPALTLGFAALPMFVYISMSSFVLQAEPYTLSEQGYGMVFAGNAVGIMAAGRLNARLGVSLGPRRMLGISVAVITGACAYLVVATTADWPLWTVLAGLFLAVASLGFAFANGTFLSLEGHAGITGTASALLGLLQFTGAAVVPPAVSVLGVSGPVMALTMLGCAVLAVLMFTGIPRRTPAT